MAYQDSSGQWFDDSGNPIADPSQPAPAFVPATGNQFTNTSPTANQFPAGSGPVVANAGTPWALTQQQLEAMNAAGGVAPGSANWNLLNPGAATTGTSGSGTDWQGLQQSIFGSQPSVSGYTPPPFSYDPFNAPAPFSAPSGQDVLNSDPGYQFRVDQGTGAMQNSAAARGVLNTGGTLQDLLNYGQNAASQEYGNAYNRDLGTYQTNYQNALNAYQTNFGDALAGYNSRYQTQFLNPLTFLQNQYQTGMAGQQQLFGQQFQTATA